MRAHRRMLNVVFNNPKLNPFGIDVLTIAELRLRTPAAVLMATQRVDFLHILLIRSGQTHHTVDSERVSLKAQNILIIKPGQIHQWDSLHNVDGILLLVRDDILPTGFREGDIGYGSKFLDYAAWPTVCAMNKEQCGSALEQLQTIQDDLQHTQVNELNVTILRYQVFAFLLRIISYFPPIPCADVMHTTHKLADLFVMALEKNYMHRLAIQEYAAQLNTSSSSLTRICIKKFGLSAKEMIDNRVILEAKRLLIHTDFSVKQIASDLGFTESTNFIKFFKRKVGQTPQCFVQKAQRTKQSL